MMERDRALIPRARSPYATKCSKCVPLSPPYDRTARFPTCFASADARGCITACLCVQDDVIFDAVVVTRNSPEGRMMSKWLTAARIKLGGTHLFPRPEARSQMERCVAAIEQHEADMLFKLGGDSGHSELIMDSETQVHKSGPFFENKARCDHEHALQIHSLRGRWRGGHPVAWSSNPTLSETTSESGSMTRVCGL